MSNKPFQVGITGGIGSGKSIVCRVYQTLGVPIYDADHRARALMDESKSLKQKIMEAFGEKSYGADGKLNRSYLAEQVFHDEKKLQRLNQWVHPEVGHDYQEWVSKQDSAIVVKEAALLFEAGSWQNLDEVVLVAAPESVRLQRIKKRDPHRSESQINAIMARQWSDDKKANLANHVLNNDGSQLMLPLLLSWYRSWQKKSRSV